MFLLQLLPSLLLCAQRNPEVGALLGLSPGERLQSPSALCHGSPHSRPQLAGVWGVKKVRVQSPFLRSPQGFPNSARRGILSSQRGTKSISLIGHVCVELRGAAGFFLLWIH